MGRADRPRRKHSGQQTQEAILETKSERSKLEKFADLPKWADHPLGAVCLALLALLMLVSLLDRVGFFKLLGMG